MKSALVLSDHDLTHWRAAHHEGLRPSALPYGIDRLERHGISVSSATVSSDPRISKVRAAIERRVDLPIEQPLRSARLAARADLVIALLEQHAFAPSLLKGWRIPPYSGTPIAALSCWLAEEVSHASKSQRDRLRRRLGEVDLLMYLSANQTEIFLDLGMDARRLLPVPFGVDAEFYSPADAVEDIDVLAVGHDRGRDYATLFKAVEGADLTLDVVCGPSNLQGLVVPPNVGVRERVSHVEYRALMRRAKVVVVPTRELAYPTGQSVALEAAACSKCVVATGTVPLREYLDDGVDAILVPPGDPRALGDALYSALSGRDLRERMGVAARNTVLSRYTTQHMWDNVIEALRERRIL